MDMRSEEFQQDVREVTRTDCSQIAKMALLSEEIRQDVKEVTRTDCSGCQRSHENRLQPVGEDGTFVGRVPTGRQRSHENRLQSGCEHGHFVGRVPTGCRIHFCENHRKTCILRSKSMHERCGQSRCESQPFVGRAPTRCPNTGKQASYAGIDT